MEEQEFYEITIIQYIQEYNDNADQYEQCITKVTDWTKVSKADYDKLIQASRLQSFKVITRPQNMEEFIKDALKKYEDYLAENKRLQAEYDARQRRQAAERAKKALAKKMKMEAKTVEDKRKLLEALKAELEPVVKLQT